MAQFHMPRKIARGTTHHEARQELANECIEIKQPSLIKQHGRCRGGNHLSQAGHVENCIRHYGRRVFFICELPQSPMQDSVSARQNAKSAARKGAGHDRVLQNPPN
jgi:hypothetical protein